MAMIPDPDGDTQQTIADLNAKVRECIFMGRPSDAVDYSQALLNAAGAWDYITHEDTDG